MLLLRLMASPSGKQMFPFMTKYSLEPLSSLSSEKVLWKTPRLVNNNDTHHLTLERFFHTSHVHKDMEGAFRAIGGGIAAMGVIGPGVGIGLVFGNLLSATARNPSLSNKLFQYGIMGAAFCESIAFFALMISFMTFA